MTVYPILCVFLLNCFSSLLTNFGECPANCDCYSAPEGGNLEDTAYSLICYEKKEYSKNDLSAFKDKIINTIAFSKIDFNLLPQFYLEDLSVNNLIFFDSGIDENKPKSPLNGIKIFSGLKTENLTVITFINVKLQIRSSQFAWNVFQLFDQLKAIYIEGGDFENINSEFSKIPGNNILTATFDNTKLKTIEKNVFNSWKKLRMLTVSRNLIEDLDWMPLDLKDLWYLDLRRNKIKSFPQVLVESLISLRVLKLGENQIRTISENTMKSFLNLKEFSFDKIPEKGDQRIVSKSDYFYASKEMAWILKYAKNTSLFPELYYESFSLVGCQRWDVIKENFYYPCIEIENELDFDADYSDHIIVKNADFSIQNREVFLSGVNFAYIFSEKDFEKEKPSLESLLNEVKSSGGNSVRILLDYNNKLTHSTAPDILPNALEESVNLRIRYLSYFLDAAQKYNIFVILCLWRADYLVSPLVREEEMLQSFIDNNLIPIIEGLSKYKSLTAWDIIDKPEYLIKLNVPDNDICFNTSGLSVSSQEKQQFLVTMKQMLRFIGLQSSIIHRVDPKALVTVGMSEETTNFGSCSDCFNYYQDMCLQLAVGDKPNSVLDFYEIQYKKNKFLINKLINLDINKPIIIGEVEAKSFTKLNNYIDAYDFSYSGIFGSRYDVVNDDDNADDGDDGGDDDQLQTEAVKSILNEEMKAMVDYQPEAIKIIIE